MSLPSRVPPPRAVPAYAGEVPQRYRLLMRAILVGLLFSSPVWLAIMFFTAPSDAPYEASLFWVPLFSLMCVWMLSIVWGRDTFLRQLFGTAVLARVAAAAGYLWVSIKIYNWAADATSYWGKGLVLAAAFDSIGWAAFQPPYRSTNLVNIIAGALTLVTGDALAGLFVLFALAALWGGYFFYRAFRMSFPKGDHHLYGILIVFLPSVLFWSSALSKDALEQLFIGMTAYGFARFLQKHDFMGGLACTAGLAGAGLIRPHIGATLALACVVPYAFAGATGHKMRAAAKVLLVPLLIAATIYMVTAAGTFVGAESPDVESSVAAAGRIARSTHTGESAYSGSLPVRLAMFPLLIFRPLPWEVHNLMAGAAGLEAIALLVFCWKRRRDFKDAMSRWRSPFIGFILIFSIEFSLAFAVANSNFGILVRERIMLVPLFLMLFCAYPSQSARADGEPEWLSKLPPALREHYVAGLAKRTEP